MKRFLLILPILFALASCEKEEDVSKKECTPGFTTISGRIVTTDNSPLKGVKVGLKYVEQSMFSYHSWLKRTTTTDANGFYSMSFNIEDGEVMSFEGQSYSYFDLQVDLGNLDQDKYFLSCYSVESSTSNSLNSNLSLKQDTTYNMSFYFPTKGHIAVTLKGFQPTQTGDCFEVQTFFPWGSKSDGKNMLNTEYGISSSGYDNFVAKTYTQTFSNVPVALNDTNIVRIVKVKNGVATPEDHKIFIPENKAIELTYEY